jgi:hypothetical protein
VSTFSLPDHCAGISVTIVLASILLAAGHARADWKTEVANEELKLNNLAYQLCREFLTEAQSKHYKKLAEDRMLPIEELNKVVAGVMEADYEKETGLKPDTHVSVTIYRSCPIIYTRIAQDLLMGLEQAVTDNDAEYFKAIKERIYNFEIDCEECLPSEVIPE